MKTYLVQDYLNAVEAIAPFSLAESWDNPGLLIGSGHQQVRRALVALDATLAVIQEAQEAGADLIVTHHPVIYEKLGRISAESPVYQAIQKGIAVISAHTNLDTAKGGVNDALAARLGLKDVSLLEKTRTAFWKKVIVYVPTTHAEAVYNAMTQAGAGRQGNYAGAAFFSPGEGRFIPLEGANPFLGEVGGLEKAEELRLEMLVTPGCIDAVICAMRKAHPYEEPAFDILDTQAFSTDEGMARVGDLEQSFSPDEFAAYVKERLKVGGIKYVPGEKKIQKVALCGGTGGSFLARAAAAGAQALVTADVKHSQLLEAVRLGMTLIDGGHYATEAVVLPVLLEKLQQALPGAHIQISAHCADPARYLAG
jgi:dinuclear metal center YbgI/SA1388 family protein